MAAPALIAIVAPTASGKSDLGFCLAKECDGEIFSIDSLSIYKYINIASAKPSPAQLQAIRHYGINELEPQEHCNAIVFVNLLNQAIQTTSKKVLFIVGGSGFYLWSMIEGLSPVPQIDSATITQITHHIASLPNPYTLLSQIDPESALHIKPRDTYRIHKCLELYFATNQKPSAYLRTHPKIPLPYPIQLYSIQTQRSILRQNIAIRTQNMIKEGIINEAQMLLERYSAQIQPFKAIGLKECLAYLEQKISLAELQSQITTHTNQLAKRQETFNRSKFPNAITLPKDKLYTKILADIKNLL